MPTIYDNIENILADELKNAFATAYKADLCVGYFNLRGWNNVAHYIDDFSGGENAQCRLIIGMQPTPQQLIKSHYSKIKTHSIDNQTAKRLQRQLAEEFRTQLTLGYPTNTDEATLKQLAEQLKAEKLTIKLFVAYPLHAKLYLIHRHDKFSPILTYLGSSNLTFSGLSRQGELNIDVPDKDAANKLMAWFEERWDDNYCLDISQDLINIIEESWVTPKLPYYIYLKIAYHLSQEARDGLNEFKIPAKFKNELLDFQQKAVLIAAHYLNKRNGVLIGDVVGLGKTITATALIKLFDDDFGFESLILCPKNLTTMWEDYSHRYGLRSVKVLSQSQVIKILPNLRRYRLVVIDESHNLRNKDGKIYKAIYDYIKRNNSKVILLSATPYNKSYADLSGQLALFIDEHEDLGISPERYMQEIGGQAEFIAKHQTSPRSLAAFNKSDHPDDWRELMRLYLVRRTRGFIQKNFSQFDEQKQRYYLEFANGTRNYFPERIAKKVEYPFDENNTNDPYAQLYSETIVKIIDTLHLPRYGLLDYLSHDITIQATQAEDIIIQNLTRAGKRLKGFARTNLFKRLESGGEAFLLSIYRHIMRNYVFIYALNKHLPIPVGQQESALLDSFITDESDLEQNDDIKITFHNDIKKYYQDAGTIYHTLQDDKGANFKWINSAFFIDALKNKLTEDSISLHQILKKVPQWHPEQDRKLQALSELITVKHAHEKLLIFTQFSDTADYLYRYFKNNNIASLACVTGKNANPTDIARCFSPISNKHEIQPENEHRVLITTDVLSEGQNLQDAHIIVNYDLPWAIIRLIQRAGRVDRIGQQADTILCYSFLPEDGIEKIINLRNRLMQRIEQNADVVGSDERFFEGDPINIHDLYSEKNGILNEQEDKEIDLPSYALQIWNAATNANPALKTLIPKLPDVIYSSKAASDKIKTGVIVYAKTSNDNDVLTWLDNNGNIITQSQFSILNAAACSINTPITNRADSHHDLIEQSMDNIHELDATIGGQLGKKTGARYQVYHRLKVHYDHPQCDIFYNAELKKAIDEIYSYPLQEIARETLSRQLKIGLSDEQLAQSILHLRAENKYCRIVLKDDDEQKPPSIICSLGLV
ncbi:NgoFVII family restriction endonuclease [Crenothrix sp. D3]|nr:NgoFVII family restriction endonuclease [Crenothrix sp. D3]